MKLAFIVVLLFVITPSLSVRLQRLQHSWWCSKDQDSAPFKLINDKWGNIYPSSIPGTNTWQYVYSGVQPAASLRSTWLDGKKKIKAEIPTINYDLWLVPSSDAILPTSNVYAAFAGNNWSKNRKEQVYLIDCPSEKGKVEVIAKNENGVLSYLYSVAKNYYCYFATDAYMKTNNIERQCFTVKN